MTTATGLTPFPLGAYIGNPDNSSAANESIFEGLDASFTQLMGAAPQYLVYYLDQNQPISQWIGNASWAADSASQSPAARSAIPVIGLPMATRAPSTMTADQYFQAFASGQYDSVIRGVVESWASAGFATQYWRPGWEMNLTSSVSYAGSDSATQADWVAAFQHISTVLHQAGQADGVNVQVVWNPSITNYTNAEATTSLYPGNSYVDVIGADIYADMYPYNPLYDWDKNNGTVDGSLAQWMADPINREHYWTYPAATPYSLDGSAGHSLSLTDLLQFAKAQGKPFALPETGAGNSNGGQDVADDGTFPQWLAQTLQASGDQIKFVDLWNSNGGGNYEFSSAADGKPNEAAAWAKYFGASPTTPAPLPTAPAPVTIGAGTDTLSLSIAEDAWQGDAKFTISVDGVAVGGIQSALASHAAGQTQTFNILGNFGTVAHSVSVSFLNDAYGGTALADRNLYVVSAAEDGVAIPGASLSLFSAGAQSFLFHGTTAAPAAILSPTDTLDLHVSEDAWQGDAQFLISVDGKPVGGVQTATASHGTGATQDFSVSGNWGDGPHTVGMTFINDAWGGTPSTDRNLYVDSVSYDGHPAAGAPQALMSNGTANFAVSGAAVNVDLVLHMAEDAWQGDAMYSLSLDGQPTGQSGVVTALNALGHSQAVDLKAALSPGVHDLGISFLNDAYGGSPATDRNLFATGVDLNGAPVAGAAVALYSQGTGHIQIFIPAA